MAKNSEKEDPREFEKIESSLTKAEQYIEQNQKKLTYIIGALVLIVAGFYSYRNLIQKPKELEAQERIWQAEQNFAIDSFSVALYGNGNAMGFEEIIADYGSTKAGNLANYYAGICCLRLKEYDQALEYLNDFETDEPLLLPTAITAIGDCYSELGEYEKAAEKYTEAAGIADDAQLSSIILMKAGLHYEKLGNKEKAHEIYSTIKEKYSTSDDARSIDKYLTRTSN